VGRRGQAQVKNLCYRGKAKQDKQAQVENLCYRGTAKRDKEAQVENRCYGVKAKRGKEAQVDNLCYWERRSEGLPVPRELGSAASEATMAKRGQHRESVGQDARSERPTTGHGQPRAARRGEGGTDTG